MKYLPVDDLNPRNLVVPGQPVEVRSIYGDIYVGKYIDEDDKVIRIVDESGKTHKLSKTEEIDLDSFRKVENPQQRSRAVRNGKNYILQDEKYVFDPLTNEWKKKGFFTDETFTKLNEPISPEKLETIIQLEASRMNAPVPLVEESMAGRFELIAQPFFTEAGLFINPKAYEQTIFDLLQHL